MTEQAKIRRIQDTLTIAGSGVIAFSVWSLAKIGLFLTLVDKDVLRRILGIDDDSLIITVYALLGVIALIDFGVRAFVGLSARAEGRGKKKSPVYLVVAAIVAISNASSLGAIAVITSLALSPSMLVVSIVIEVTAIAALVLVIYSSICLRRAGKTTG